MATIINRLTAAVTAFRQPYLMQRQYTDKEFVGLQGRRLRYEYLWALYQNNAYSNIHQWAQSLKTSYGLYKYIRNIYNPAHRLVEYYISHVWGGMLDPDAGAGTVKASAIPIMTNNESIREPIARLWRDSNWQVEKDTVVRWGAALGDVAIAVRDDPAKGRVWLDAVHPTTIEDKVSDPQGNIRAYVIEEPREHPDTGKDVTYREEAERDGDNVVYRTYLNNELYAWTENGAEWSVPYGFVPMVYIPHQNVGDEWGWSAIHSQLSRAMEVDDLASKLHDYIRKAIDPFWYFTGTKPPTTTQEATETTPTDDKPQAGREDMHSLWSPNGDAKALVAQVQMGESAARIHEVIEDMERELPELQMDVWRELRDVSGKALRNAGQRAEKKTIRIRSGYDDAMVRAHQMGVSIGGWREYEGYEGFGLESFDAGDLAHVIDERPVFAVDPVDRLEEQLLFWQVVNEALAAGAPVDLVLRDQGWPEDKIAEAVEAIEGKAAQDAERDAFAQEAARIGRFAPQPTPQEQREAGRAGGREPQPEELTA